MSPLAEIAVVGGAVVLGWLVPWVFMRMLVPSLRNGRTSVNYRGREVFLGLGVVWLVWAGCAIVAGIGAASVIGHGSLPVLTLAGPLALVAFALGMVDDALGTSTDRGFGGHLRALARGRLTTGGLKLIGIGFACLVVAAIVSQAAPWGDAVAAAGFARASSSLILAALVLVAGASVALSSNFINLMDLRPGRALKAYSALAVLGACAAGLMLGAARSGLAVSAAQRLVDVGVLVLFVLGPVFAVWRYDLGEHGMLGDAGANPMGAVAGLLIVSGLPWWGLLVYFAVMLALNLASERVSYSRVIEGNALLARLDGWGRQPDSEETRAAAKSSPDSETLPE